MRRLSWKVLLGATLSLVGIGYLVWLVMFPETLGATAIRLHGCIERSDAGCLIRHVHETERKQLDLDQAKLRKLLLLTTDKILTGGDHGQLTLNVQAEQARATAQRDYAGQNGVRVAITLTVQVGDDLTTCSPLVWQLVRAYALARAAERTSAPAGIPDAFAAALRESQADFESIGLVGVVEPGTGGKLQTWSMLVEHWDGVANAVRNRSKRGVLAP